MGQFPNADDITTWRRIGDLLSAFPPQECANYLRMPDVPQRKRIRL
jgi:hypothetical protein